MLAKVKKTYTIEGKISIQDLRDIEMECQIAFNCGDCYKDVECEAIHALYGLSPKAENHKEIKRLHNKALKKLNGEKNGNRIKRQK